MENGAQKPEDARKTSEVSNHDTASCRPAQEVTSAEDDSNATAAARLRHYFTRERSQTPEEKMQKRVKTRSIGDSVGHAIDGVLWSVLRERNMRIDIVVALILLVASLLMNFTKLEFVLLTFAILWMFFAEMINTAIEHICDLIVGDTYNDFVRIAKDVAAGGVLLSAINAAIIGYLLFFDKFLQLSNSVLSKIRASGMHRAVIALSLVVLCVVLLKALFYRGHGTPLRGGSVSGHAAVSFSIATAGTMIVRSATIGVFFLILAFLVAESRYEAKIHTAGEVILGALLGSSLTAILFFAFG